MLKRRITDSYSALRRERGADQPRTCSKVVAVHVVLGPRAAYMGRHAEEW